MGHASMAGFLAVEKKEMCIGEMKSGQRTCCRIIALEKGDAWQGDVESVKRTSSWIDSGGKARCASERGNERTSTCRRWKGDMHARGVVNVQSTCSWAHGGGTGKCVFKKGGERATHLLADKWR